MKIIRIDTYETLIIQPDIHNEPLPNDYGLQYHSHHLCKVGRPDYMNLDFIDEKMEAQ